MSPRWILEADFGDETPPRLSQKRRRIRRAFGGRGEDSNATSQSHGEAILPISVDRGAPRCQRLSWTGRAAYDCRGSTAEAAGRKCPDSLTCSRRPREWEQGTLSSDARRLRAGAAVECRGGHDRLDPALARAEPIVLLAAIKQDLHRMKGAVGRRDAGPICPKRVSIDERAWP
jgi:hypothetical protein